MENELIKEQDFIFKAYQRKLLRKLERVQEGRSQRRYYSGSRTAGSADRRHPCITF